MTGRLSDGMRGVTNGKVVAFGGVEVQLPICRPAGADIQGVLENIMAISHTGGCLLTIGRAGH